MPVHAVPDVSREGAGPEDLEGAGLGIARPVPGDLDPAAVPVHAVAEAETDETARREVGREVVVVHEERAPDRAAGGGGDREGTPEPVDAVDELAASGGSVERPWMDLLSA